MHIPRAGQASAPALTRRSAAAPCSTDAAETKIERRIERMHALDDPRFTHEPGLRLCPPFLPGTQVRALLNSDEILAPMFAAIRAAEPSITCETCIHWSGEIGAHSPPRWPSARARARKCLCCSTGRAA